MSLPNLTKEKELLILDAAQNRFARFGFSKVTMDEIAEDIGMAKASLYYYYPTKEHVFREVIQRETSEFLRQAAGILDKPTSAAQKLTTYVRRRVVLGNQLLNLSALHAKFWQDLKPGFRDLFVTFASEELQMLTRIFREGKKTGEFSVTSPEKTASMVLHVLQGLRLRHAQASQFRGENGVRLDELQADTDLLIETLLQGILKRTDHEKGFKNHGTESRTGSGTKTEIG